MRVGILGGGQLGRMLALAGYPLGLEFRHLDLSPTAPVRSLGELVAGEYDDEELLEDFAAGLDVVTYEFENVPVRSARFLERSVAVWPPSAALEAAQDRMAEKALFGDLGIETAPFAAVGSREALERAIAEIGVPAVLKTRRLGYDGKGQFVLRTEAEADAAWAALGGVPLILEGFVAFERELSILAARGADGDAVFYPLVENHHRGGILRLSLAPAPAIDAGLQARAEALARRVLERLGYVGVLAIELFQAGERLLANEMAPRVHNSGHWTIEGAGTSQFENHLRAVCGLPLGSAAPVGASAMLNLIGGAPDAAAVLRHEDAHLHLYGKRPRPGRKIGHVTLRAPDADTLAERLGPLRDLVEDAAG